ncbi:hypothetical protein OIU84_025484 [Salix udensis]|uniref:Beta-amylase n=1 Tax=Salix udensis TaxID=889485 RepID=A0AAD6KJP4_9ROSI|nr:hypothetical protein OIU84_025484 [Salix udensis]
MQTLERLSVVSFYLPTSMSLRVPLPKWVVEEVGKDQDLAYTDQWGRRNYEYVSLGCDSILVFKGRTPVQCYSDFMRAFRDNFKHLSDTIVVGMGPAGELRFPSYPEQNGTWKFPGIEAFQCYNKGDALVTVLHGF